MINEKQELINYVKMYKKANLSSFALGTAVGAPLGMYAAKKMIAGHIKRKARDFLLIGGTGLGAGFALNKAISFKDNQGLNK